MIWAFLIYLFYGASSGGGHAALGGLTTAHLKPQVEKVVQDEGRRGAALDALARTSKDIDRLNDRIAKDLGRFQELVEDYGSTPEDFDRQFEAAAARDLQQADAVWRDRAALLGHVRPDEWSAIVAGARADAAKEAAKKSGGK